MDRRGFLRLLGVGAATVAVAPKLVPAALQAMGPHVAPAPSAAAEPLTWYTRPALISRELFEDSNPAYDQIIRADLSRLLTREQDRLILGE
jgi:hypothetical protein